MRIIITGGSGLIGRALAEKLASDNYEVIILSRTPERLRDFSDNIRAEQWDGQSASGWGHLANGAGAIINLAGENIAAGRWTEKRKQRLYSSRINAGRAVVEAVKVAVKKPNLVIQASAVGYYGPRQEEQLTESSAPGRDFLAELCQDWEASTEAVEALGVRRVIIRTGVVLSREGGAFPQMALPFKLFAGGPLGSGKQWLPWIHLADEIAAIQFLLEQDTASGPFNLTAPNPLPNAKFGRVLGKTLHRPALISTPGLALKAAFGEMATVLLEGQRALPHRLLELGFTFQYPTPEAALRELLSKPFVFRYRHQFEIKAPLAQVSDFHSQSSSMAAITPPPVVVKVHRAPTRLTEGDEMDFTLWLGPFPIRWLARIENVTKIGFIDRQLKGPFQHWVHHHTFELINDQTTRVVDEIEFSLNNTPWWKMINLKMALNLPLLFAYRGWKTRRMLEDSQQAHRAEAGII